MEYLDVVDELGNPTGQIVERTIAHEKGIRHRTSHVWIIRKKEKLEILLQLRSKEKDSFPSCFDISTAGHIPAGCSYVESAIREAKEELGIEIDEKKLIYCGKQNREFKGEFHGNVFHDVQISNVYCYYLDQDQFTVQKEEIEKVVWMSFDDCVNGVKHNLFNNCIFMDELELIENTLKQISLENYL
ncbi:NUDIX hydrolase [Floccifex sp.]